MMPRQLLQESTGGMPASPAKPKFQPKQRISHTKSRNGCYACKNRRVKCDEERPVCGACSVRGDDCAFPPPSTARDPSRRHHESRPKAAEPQGTSIRPLNFNVPRVETVNPQIGSNGSLNMHDLKLQQHFILYTSKRMTLHHEKALVWERVIPNVASKKEYLMHLLLALAGLDMLTTGSPFNPSATDPKDQLMVTICAKYVSQITYGSLLQIVVEHHQQGLKGLQEELATAGESNPEDLLAGSMLIVGFAFASLRVGELDSGIEPYPAMDYTPQSGQSDLGRPQAQWLNLARGSASLIQHSWMELQRSRLRPLLLFNQANDHWKHFKHELSTPIELPREIRSARLSIFVSNASQAIYNLRDYSRTLRAAVGLSMDNSESPGSESSAADPTYSLLQGNDQAIETAEVMYMRVLHVLSLPRIGALPLSDHEIQIEIEDTAIASWPHLVSQDFISSLDPHQPLGPIQGLSFTILAHLHLTLALVKDVWVFGRTFDLEIKKIAALVTQIADNRLIELMQWPMSVINES